MKPARAPRSPVILCLDDEATPLAIRKMVLQRSGYTVIGATSGSQALRILHSVRIDLVLSDHFLQGERGTDVAAQMKAIRPELPILILSGAADMLEPSPHIDGVIQKGDSTTSLLVEIARALRL